jgi:LysM repeat protein
MRLSVSDLAYYASQALRGYWRWMYGYGSLPRFAIGYAVPIALLALAINLAQDDGGMPDNFAADAPRTGTSQVAGVSVAQGTAGTPPPNASSSPQATPTVGRSVLTYVVVSGDTLGAICAAQMRSMEVEACVRAIVQLNTLSGPDQLAVGQTLSLPEVGGPSPSTDLTAAARAPTRTGTPPSATPRPAGTATSSQGQNVKIDSISSPIKPGETASLKATVAPNASCSLQYAPPAGTTDVANSVLAKSAEASGAISWTWDIAEKTKKGRGVVAVTCGGISVSAYIVIS